MAAGRTAVAVATAAELICCSTVTPGCAMGEVAMSYS